MNRIAIFTGSAHPALAQAICDNMPDEETIGIVTQTGLRPKLGKATVGRFSDGEVRVQILDDVRGADVYVVQPTCGTETSSVNDSVIELLVMVDAFRRSSAASITVVNSYFGYARQDRKAAPRTPISAALVAHLLEAAGVDRVVACDLHAAQIQGFFQIPVDNLYARPAMVDELAPYTGCTIVSPDAGGAERARAYAKSLGASLAIIDKRRGAPNESEVMHILGDVKDRTCLILDDMIDTAGTLTHAAEALMKAGALSVAASATHAVLSGPAVQRIKDSCLHEVIITDSIPLSAEARACGKFRVVSLAPLFAKAIYRIHRNQSVSSLFAS